MQDQNDTEVVYIPFDLQLSSHALDNVMAIYMAIGQFPYTCRVNPIITYTAMNDFACIIYSGFPLHTHAM